MGLFSGLLGGAVSLVGGLLGKSSEKKQIEAQNRANQQATQASIEQTNQWRSQDRQWAEQDGRDERDFSREMLSRAQIYDAEQIEKQNAYNDPSQVRARAEAAGFNPLALLGTGVGMQAGAASSGSVPYGGGAGGVATTIAPAADIVAAPVASSDLSLIGEAFGAGMQEYSTAVSEATQLRQHNDALKQELAKAVVRPAVGGIYGGGDVPVQMIAANKYGSKGGDEVAELIGPRNAVNLFNPTANKWIKIHPGLAERLELKDGDTIMAEDYEAIMGDVGSEIVNTPNAVNEMAGFGIAFPYDGRDLSATKYGGPMSEKPASSTRPKRKTSNKNSRDYILDYFNRR